MTVFADSIQLSTPSQSEAVTHTGCIGSGEINLVRVDEVRPQRIVWTWSRIRHSSSPRCSEPAAPAMHSESQFCRSLAYGLWIPGCRSDR